MAQHMAGRQKVGQDGQVPTNEIELTTTTIVTFQIRASESFIFPLKTRLPVVPTPSIGWFPSILH